LQLSQGSSLGETPVFDAVHVINLSPLLGMIIIILTTPPDLESRVRAIGPALCFFWILASIDRWWSSASNGNQRQAIWERLWAFLGHRIPLVWYQEFVAQVYGQFP
jgi:hypothetical protein